MMTLGGNGWRVYGNSPFCLCKFFCRFKIIKKKICVCLTFCYWPRGSNRYWIYPLAWNNQKLGKISKVYFYIKYKNRQNIQINEDRWHQAEMKNNNPWKTRNHEMSPRVVITCSLRREFQAVVHGGETRQSPRVFLPWGHGAGSPGRPSCIEFSGQGIGEKIAT